MRRINVLKFIFLGFVISLFLTSSNVFATLGNGFNEGLYNQVTSEGATDLDKPVFKIMHTIMILLQVCAMAGVVITGVKYMYAGSEDKGKIKQTLIWLVIGSIFVFAAPSIITFISNASKAVL